MRTGGPTPLLLLKAGAGKNDHGELGNCVECVWSEHVSTLSERNPSSEGEQAQSNVASALDQPYAQELTAAGREIRDHVSDRGL